MGLLRNFINSRQVLGSSQDDNLATESQGTMDDAETNLAETNLAEKNLATESQGTIETGNGDVTRTGNDGDVTRTGNDGVDVVDDTPTQQQFYEMLNERDKFVKEGADKKVNEWVSQNAPEAETPEEKEKREKREKSLRSWALVSDIFKNLANAYGVTQGISSSNWGNTASNAVQAEQEEGKEKRSDRMKKYLDKLEDIKKLSQKDLADFWDARNKEKEARYNKKKTEDRQAEQDANSAKKEKVANVERMLREGSATVQDLTDAGFTEDQAQRRIDAMNKEIKAKAQKNADAHNRAIKNGNQNKSVIKVVGADGKEMSFSGTGALNQAYIKVMQAQGKSPKKKATDVEKWEEIIKWQNAHHTSSADEVQSMREQYLTKRGEKVADGSNPEDWA